MNQSSPATRAGLQRPICQIVVRVRTRLADRLLRRHRYALEAVVVRPDGQSVVAESQEFCSRRWTPDDLTAAFAQDASTDAAFKALAQTLAADGWRSLPDDGYWFPRFMR